MGTVKIMISGRNRLNTEPNLDNLETKTIICNKLRGKALKWLVLNYSRTKCCVELNAEDLLRELRKM